MPDKQHDIGIIGLGTMGGNLGLNFAEHGYTVAGHDRDQEHIDGFLGQAREQLAGAERVSATTDVQTFIASLSRPRAVLLLLPAGKVVDQVIDTIAPMLDHDDIIIDGGNSHFTDTDERESRLTRQHVHFIGMGISGGSEGARHGPSMMPGGSKPAWEHLRPLLQAAAAKVDGTPCVEWLGRGSAGHYVKMAHNGIEYGLMQLIAETYDLMRRVLHLDHQRMHDVFREWSQQAMGGYLLEITADIMLKHDADSDAYLLDRILDAAHQKGTGVWTSEEALQVKVPTPVIDTAVTMRMLSDFRRERQRASELLGGPLQQNHVDAQAVLPVMGTALHGAMIMTYAQGMHLLYQGGRQHEYGLHLEDVARIWRGGCIIRSQLLNDLAVAYTRNPALHNPMFDERLAETLLHTQTELRQTVQLAAREGVPAPGFMAALAYYDAYRSAALPANLIQAQRDCFGAHTFERTDKEGVFHAEWTTH
jgi:6-phosphogluconate dehydrogenase